MKYLKKAIIILLILSVIIFICILILNRTSQAGELENTEVDRTQDFIKDMGIVDDYGTFFSVEKMLNKFIEYVASNNKEATYSLLDNTYIQENKITKDKVLEEIVDITEYDDSVKIRKMYRQENAENAVYYMDCILEKEHIGKEFYFAMYEDSENFTYSIEPIMKNVFDKEVSDSNRVLEEKQIEKNEYNKTEEVIPSEKERVTKYFKDFIENALYYPEYTYSILDQEYKNKRFPKFQDFQKYLEEKKQSFLTYANPRKAIDFETTEEYLIYLSQINKMELEGYQIINQDEYNRYICTDNFGNYYIFYANKPFSYSLMLDTYTIDLPEFKEKYERATKEEKLGLNIQKIVEALNGKDYNYIYSKLAEEFKANYFKTYKDFEKYAKETFDVGNEVTFNKYGETEDLCTYQITLKGKNKTVIKTIVMRFEEGTDFVMSFNIE